MRGLMLGKVSKAKTESSSETSAAAATEMGVYKLTLPGDASPSKTSTTTAFRHANVGRRFIPSYTPARVQPVAKSTSLESPELEHFNTVATAMSATDTISEDDATSVFTSSTRTSNTISDDDISLADFAVRTASAEYFPARHSTACCTDVALRRELRKKFLEPTLGETPNTLSDSFAMGHSFRRELEVEDRVESLALWEESEMLSTTSSRDRSISKDMPHSWHGDTASSMSGRNKGLESLFRKPKKSSSSFFNGFFSGLPFSAARRFRKS